MNRTTFPQLMPLDNHNLELQSNVHPTQWKNPVSQQPYHLVVIGAGTAGLVTAAGAAGLGARVALIERGLMGGDCLNVGCVPSKAIISASRVAASFSGVESFGFAKSVPVKVDFAAVMNRMRAIRASISPVDSAQRFSELGVDVYFGAGKFVDNQTVEVVGGKPAESKLTFKKAVIATGARASAPPISGLSSVKYLTNETLFSLTELPKRFGIVGGGPIGSEMAQAFARLGSDVYLFEMADHILSREDPEAADLVQDQMLTDGVNLVLDAKDMQLQPDIGDAINVRVRQNDQAKEFVVDQLLIAVGRAPNVDGMNLKTVNVDYDNKGVAVNDFLQTTNPRIYAAGDICSKYQFTHAADFMARIVIQNALYALGPVGRKRVSDLIVPWATYTSPEIAHVGMYPNDANQAGVEIDTYIQPFEHVDRAILESKTEGFVKIHTRQGTDKIVGATIVAENAGDLISEITVAMKNKVGLSGIGSAIHPYPTTADAIRKLGDQYNKTKLTPFSKMMLGLLQRFNVGS